MVPTHMEKNQITIEKDGSVMTFVTEAHEDYIVLVRYITDNLSTVWIPDDIGGIPVREIGYDCFFNHREITEIVFSENLRTIGDQAFALCKGIKELYLPDGISEIGYYAFRDCTGLKKIVLPASLKILKRGVFAFSYLPDDVDVTLNEGLEIIQSRVFSSGGLNLFFTVKIPSSVKECAPDAFEPGITIISADGSM